MPAAVSPKELRLGGALPRPGKLTTAVDTKSAMQKASGCLLSSLGFQKSLVLFPRQTVGAYISYTVGGGSSVDASPVPHLLLGPLASWLALPTRDTLHSSPTLMPTSLPGDPGGDLSPVLG